MTIIDYIHFLADGAGIITAVTVGLSFIYRRGVQPLNARQARKLAIQTRVTLEQVNLMQKDSAFRATELTAILSTIVLGYSSLIVSMIFISTSIVLTICSNGSLHQNYLVFFLVTPLVISAIITEIIGLKNIIFGLNVLAASRNPVLFVNQRSNKLFKFIKKQKNVDIKLNEAIELLANLPNDSILVRYNGAQEALNSLSALSHLSAQKQNI